MARIRTFVAVGLDAAVRSRVVALQDALARTGADVKWVEPENLHITLLFLGEVVDREVIDVCRAVAACCAERDGFAFEVGGVGAFPNLRRPRTLWAGVAEGKEELVDLHDALEEALTDLGGYRREERAYTPHVTLGRMSTDQNDDQLIPAMTSHAEWQGGLVQVREVLVMSSELSPRGPRYSVLSRAKLGGSE
jgi:2'-5' RNA ligase